MVTALCFLGKTVVVILDSENTGKCTVVVTMSLGAVSEQFFVVVFNLSPYTYFSKQFFAFSNRQSLMRVSFTSRLAMDHSCFGKNLVLPLV